MSRKLPKKLEKSILIKCFLHYKNSFKKFNVKDDVICEITNYIENELPSQIPSKSMEMYVDKISRVILSKHFNFALIYLIKRMVLKKLPITYLKFNRSTKS